LNIGLLLVNIFKKITDWVGEFFGCVFDLIPKVIYFLFTAFTSGIDALQCLIRKLAGLDVYYSATTGEAFARKDPLSEFIFGIIGIGNSAATYKALNTVFWSLSIFAVIMLVVTTMVAMIKAHYNEDVTATNPWKYIYTAIKAVLTFAIIPIVMVFGLKLSSFVLSTLDNITAGQVTDEEIKQVYGTDATQLFVSEKLAGVEKKSYVYYDFFGYGPATNNTPMGSMLFRASAYSANRARDGISYMVYQNIYSGGIQVFGNSNCQAFDSLTSEFDKQEYVAYQIDYAFCNNLHVQAGVSKGNFESATDGAVRYMSFLDPFGGWNSSFGSFTKFNVTLVWFCYNLWKFNFIVGFGGGVTLLGVLLSIVIGLMTRLIKGAALFLIYPPLLGIAPLDNFKAFKGWGTNLLQQVMMAFGAIVGMNILMLIIPYINNIAFFNIGIVDAIISMIAIIVGLTMVKDFIGIVSGFAGGSDALSVGNSAKSDVSSPLTKGAKTTGKLALNTGRLVGTATIKAGRLAHKGVKGGINVAKGVHASHQAKAINAYEKFEKTNMTIDDTLQNVLTGKQGKDVNKTAAKAAKKAMNKARSNGETDKEKLKEIGREAIINSLKQQNKGDESLNYRGKITTKKEQRKFDKFYKKVEKGAKLYNEFDDEELEKGLNIKRKGGSGKYVHSKFGEGFWETLGSGIKKGSSNAWSATKGAIWGEKDKDTGKRKEGSAGWQILGKKIGDGIDGIKLGKTIADSFTKSIGAVGDTAGLDKAFNSISKIFKENLSYKHSGIFADKKPEGDKLQSKIAEDQSKQANTQTAILKDIAKTMGELTKATKTGAAFQQNTWRAVQKLQGNNSNTNNSGSNNDNKGKNS